MSLEIKEISTRLIYNSRGEGSVEADVWVDGVLGRASSPSGASVGKHEAINFADESGKKTIEKFQDYRSKLIGLDASDPRSVTSALKEIDGTPNYSNIGGSAAYAITIASVDSASKALGIPLYQLLLQGKEARMPIPLGNVLGGGRHAGEGSPDIQEFLSYPKGARSIEDAILTNLEVHREVRKILAKRNPRFTGGKGDEGAWAPNISSDDALEVISEAINTISDRTGFEIRAGVDIASSSFWNEEKKLYIYSREGKKRNTEEQIQYILDLIDKYRIYYVEDPLHEEAFQDHVTLTEKSHESLIIGDDLFVTNAERLENGAKIHSCNGVILKVNQAGALGDAMDFAETATRNSYQIITSHRSGDTADAHLAHIAIGTGALMMKSGVVGGERIAKLNELLRIDELRLIREGSSMTLAQAG